MKTTKWPFSRVVITHSPEAVTEHVLLMCASKTENTSFPQLLSWNKLSQITCMTSLYQRPTVRQHDRSKWDTWHFSGQQHNVRHLYVCIYISRMWMEGKKWSKMFQFLFFIFKSPDSPKQHSDGRRRVMNHADPQSFCALNRCFPSIQDRKQVAAARSQLKVWRTGAITPRCPLCPF